MELKHGLRGEEEIFHCCNIVHFAIYGWTLTQSQEKLLDEHTPECCAEP